MMRSKPWLPFRAALLGILLAGGPARGQMTEDQFFEAVMPALVSVDWSGGRALGATWLSPEFWRYQADIDKDEDLADVVGGRKLVATMLMFVVGPTDDKPVPGLKAAAARAVLRLPDGGVLRPLRLPPMVAKEMQPDEKGGGSEFIVFRAQWPDGRAVVPPGPGRIRLELPAAGKSPRRAFEWRLPLTYPARAREEMQRAAGAHAARVNAFTAPAGELAESIVPWLTEMTFAGGAWMGVTWCPPEWWELTWTGKKEENEAEKAAFRTLFRDLTLFILSNLEGMDERALQRWAERCVLIDAAGVRHTPVKLPPEFRGAFNEGFKEGVAQHGEGVTGVPLAFKVRLDTTTKQPFRIVIPDAAGKPAATLRWQPPVAMPEAFAAALAAARAPEAPARPGPSAHSPHVRTSRHPPGLRAGAR